MNCCPVAGRYEFQCRAVVAGLDQIGVCARDRHLHVDERNDRRERTLFPPHRLPLIVESNKTRLVQRRTHVETRLDVEGEMTVNSVFRDVGEGQRRIKDE